MTDETNLIPGNKLKFKLNMEKLNSFLVVPKKYIAQITGFFKDKKNNSTMVLLVALVTSGLAIYFAIQLYNDIKILNGKVPELNNLSSYDTRTLEANDLTKSILKSSDTIKDLIQENKNTEGEITKYTDYFNALQLPYTYLLQYIYLPSLNIWKEKYTNKIDTNLIGINFLEKNPFNDISLLQKR